MNDKMDIPDGERLDVHDETDLDVPDLPGEWEWLTANHYHFNHKTNVFFGLNEGVPGGHIGEIDNYVDSEGEEVWGLHIRPIIEDGTKSGTPRPEPETNVGFTSLDEAIEAVPDQVATYYEAEQ